MNMIFLCMKELWVLFIGVVLASHIESDKKVSTKSKDDSSDLKVIPVQKTFSTALGLQLDYADQSKQCLDFFEGKGRSLDSSWTQRKPFFIIEELMGPYNIHLIHLAMSMYACRNRGKHNNLNASLFSHLNDENIDTVSYEFNKVKNNFVTNDKDSGKFTSNKGFFYKLFVTLLPSNLLNSLKYKFRDHNLFEKMVDKYPGTSNLSTRIFRYAKHSNVRSFILGHRPKTCHSVFEGSGINTKTKKCLSNMLKRTRCKNDFNAVCICDSFEYWKLLEACLYGFPYLDTRKIHDFHQKLCENPSFPPNECIAPYGLQENIIFCPEPYKGLGFSSDIEKCMKEALQNSLCQLYDVSCLCDSIAFKNSISDCFTGFLDLMNKFHSFYKALCEKPLSLYSCTKVSVKELIQPRFCDSMFKVSGFEQYQKCLAYLAITSRCGNDFDVPCICDSFSFISLAHLCFKSNFDHDAKKFSSFMKSICDKSYFFGNCINGRVNNPGTKICYRFYEYFALGNAVERCIEKLIRRSYCSNPYDIVCLCDSTNFINGLMKCFSDLYDGVEKMRFFFESLCFNPLRFSPCRNATSVSNLPGSIG